MMPYLSPDEPALPVPLGASMPLLSVYLDPPDNAHGGYDVMLMGDTLYVARGDNSEFPGTDSPIKSVVISKENTGTSMSAWITQASIPRVMAVGWGRFPDGVEVVLLYDKSDRNMGYAFNLDCDWCSEWGYAPFEVDPDVVQHHRKEDYE